MDFILIYNLIPLFCFFVDNPNTPINSSFSRLNQLICEMSPILKQFTIYVLFK